MKKITQAYAMINVIACGLFLVAFSAIMFAGEARIVLPSAFNLLLDTFGSMAALLTVNLLVSDYMYQHDCELQVLKDHDIDIVSIPAVIAVVVVAETKFKLAGPLGWNPETYLLIGLLMFGILAMWLSVYKIETRKNAQRRTLT